MKKLFLLTTLLFGLLMVGCSEDNAGTQAGNTAGFGGDNPALSINANYDGGRKVTFSVSYFGNQVTDEAYKVQWDFGDAASAGNNTASTAVAPHTFSDSLDEFTVVVNVDNADGTAVGKSTKTVIVKGDGKVDEVGIYVTDTEDPLTKQFTTKAISSSRVPVRLEWNFGGTKMVAPNNTTFTFSKYNKEYTVNLTATDMVSGDSKPADAKTVKAPVGLSIQCTQANKLVSCTPNLAGIPGGLTDAVYVWNFNQDDPTDNVTTTGSEAATYTYDAGGEKTVSVSLTSLKIEGEVKATTTVNVATNIAMDPIVCNETGNLLEYACSVNASLVNGQADTITYKWSSDAKDVKITNDTTNNATFKFKMFPSALVNPSYLVNVVATAGSDKASQSTRIEILHPTVTISQAAGDNTTVNLNAALSTYIENVNYKWVITAPDGTTQNLTGASTQFNLTQSGTYTAEVTASHASFVDNVKASTTIVNTGIIKNAVINCAPVSTGMEYVCSTDAVAVGESGQSVPLTYQWNVTRGDKGETYTFNTRDFQQKFKKYDGTYYVNLVLIAQGSEIAVSAPQVVIKTPNVGLKYTASATSVVQKEQVKFTAEITGLLEDVPVENPTYTWYAGSKQKQSGPSNTFTFSSDATLYYDIKVVVSSPSLGSTLSAVKTIAVNPDALKPEHITNLQIKCPEADNTLNTIKRKCTVTFDNSNQNQQAAKVYLVPKGVNGQPDGTPVAFSNNQTKTVVFEWPHLNIANIQDYNNMPEFTAKLGVQLYDNKGKKVADLKDSSFTVKYPKIYYEILHNLDGKYLTQGDRFIGTDANLTFNGYRSSLPQEYTYEWKVNFNGKSGSVSKTFNVNSNGDKHDFTAEMKKARFAGTVDGDPFVGESGFGVKISGNGLSKPLYAYGVNTYYGKNNNKNALGNFLKGRSWISPKAEVGYVGNQGKNSITGGFMVPIHILLNDRSLDATGWDQFCIVGVEGAAWHNNNWKDEHLYALPKGLILPQGNSPGHGKYSYYTVMGTQWDHEYGFTEERTPGVTPGQPSIPTEWNGKKYKYYPKGTWVEFKYFGFRAVHLGYMTKSGDLSSCVFFDRVENNSRDARLVVNPKDYIPNNKIPAN